MAKHTIEPRMLTMDDVLSYMHVSASWYSKRRAELDALGFPKAHPVIKRYDKKLVDAWLDKFGGVVSEKDAEEAEILDIIRNGNN